MEIVNRNKGKFGKTVSFSNNKVKMNFDINVLDLLCSYVISSNTNIRNSHLINIRNLIETLDMSIYENDIEKVRRLRFIRRGLEARLIDGIKNPTLILSYINGGIVDGDVDTEIFPELDNNELQYINETVSGALKCTFIDNDIHAILDIATRYLAEDYRYRADILKEYEEFIKYSTNKFRQADAGKMSDMVFTLEPGKFEAVINDVHSIMSSPTRGLRCSMQGLNTMLGGWFESTRFYLFAGTSGCGKSMLLANLIVQLKAANKGYITKDPTKIPTILLVTQENSVEETVDRLCSILTGNNVKNYTPQDLIYILQTKGELTLNDTDNINIHVIYKPNRSIDTSELYTIIEDLEDDGYEVIVLLQDHIKRVRSVSNHADVRLELGEVVNELKVLAQFKQIPVISVAHLNRDASRTIDEGARNNKADLTKMLGRQNVGESMLMIDNSDWAAIINDEYDSDGIHYLAFKNIKMRYAEMVIDCIFQPYEMDNKIRLVQDLHSLVPVFRETLVPQNQIPTSLNNSVPMKNSSYNNIRILEDEEDEDNVFVPTVMRYSSTPKIQIPIMSEAPTTKVSMITMLSA